MMKKIIFLKFLLLPLAVHGQNLYEELTSMGAVTIEYQLTGYNDAGRLVSSAEGKADVMGKCFKVVADKMEVYSDGETMWVLNKDADEMVITNDISFPLLTDSKVQTWQSGKKVVTYKSGSVSYKVNINEITKVLKPFDKSHFVYDNFYPELIVTDER